MLLEVKVVPNSREFRIAKEKTGWKIFLSEPAERNKANVELVKKMEKIKIHFETLPGSLNNFMRSDGLQNHRCVITPVIRGSSSASF